MVQSLGFKALIHLVPRTRDDATFHDSVRRVAAVLRSHTASVASCAVNPMFRVADDPLGRRTVFRAALEITGDGLEPGILAALAKGLDVQFGDVIHADLSSFLIGEDLSFMSSAKTPVRYQYLMRRRIGLSHDDYLKHYLEVHSKFGLKTPGIVGYRQLHVDLEASRRAAAAAASAFACRILSCASSAAFFRAAAAASSSSRFFCILCAKSRNLSSQNENFSKLQLRFVL